MTSYTKFAVKLFIVPLTFYYSYCFHISYGYEIGQCLTKGRGHKCSAQEPMVGDVWSCSLLFSLISLTAPIMRNDGKVIFIATMRKIIPVLRNLFGTLLRLM